MKRITDLERSYVAEVLDQSFSSSKNSIFTKRFEEAFANRIGVKHAIAFCNGTATMHASLEALSIGPGDEVIVPPLTMSATTFAVLHANATPIYADVDPHTFVIDPHSIEKRITAKTKAIITVALYGLSPNMKQILDIANKHQISIIEDNAEAFGSYFEDQHVGTFGIAGSFSFQASKHLTTGEGGVVTTNDDEFALRVRRAQSLGYAGLTTTSSKIDKTEIQEPGYQRHISMGWNYRMSELCAAVALAQTERMNELVDCRINAANSFAAVAKDFPSILIPQATPNNCLNSYWTWVCKLSSNISWIDFRNKFLENKGDGIYSPWLLTFNEPMFKQRNLLGRDAFIPESYWQTDFEATCPVSVGLERTLLQFKTNYFDESELEQQVDALRATCQFFSS